MDFKKPSESKQTFMYFFNMRKATNIVKYVVNALLIAAPSIPNIETKKESIERQTTKNKTCKPKSCFVFSKVMKYKLRIIVKPAAKAPKAIIAKGIVASEY